jgi:hypothetical protein
MEREALGRRARAYAAKHRWDAVVRAYREELTRIMEER